MSLSDQVTGSICHCTWDLCALSSSCSDSSTVTPGPRGRQPQYLLHVIDTEMSVALPTSGPRTAPSLGYTDEYAAPEALGPRGVVNDTTDVYALGKVLLQFAVRGKNGKDSQHPRHSSCPARSRVGCALYDVPDSECQWQRWWHEKYVVHLDLLAWLLMCLCVWVDDGCQADKHVHLPSEVLALLPQLVDASTENRERGFQSLLVLWSGHGPSTGSPGEPAAVGSQADPAR